MITFCVYFFQLLNAKLDRETDADKKDMLTRMKKKMDTSLNNAKSVIDSHGDGIHQDAVRTVISLVLLLPACCLLSVPRALNSG